MPDDHDQDPQHNIHIDDDVEGHIVNIGGTIDFNPSPSIGKPFMANSLPPDLVPRPEEYEALIGNLLDSSREKPVAITAAFKGAGGYGKTTLATAICHDERIKKAFDGGILWVTLGEKVDSLYDKVDSLIYAFTSQKSSAPTLEAATIKLGELLKDCDVLIVIDDVWQFHHLRPFLRGGERCARLITTRNSDVLPPNTHENKWTP